MTTNTIKIDSHNIWFGILFAIIITTYWLYPTSPLSSLFASIPYALLSLVLIPIMFVVFLRYDIGEFDNHLTKIKFFIKTRKSIQKYFKKHKILLFIKKSINLVLPAVYTYISYYFSVMFLTICLFTSQPTNTDKNVNETQLLISFIYSVCIILLLKTILHSKNTKSEIRKDVKYVIYGLIGGSYIQLLIGSLNKGLDYYWTIIASWGIPNNVLFQAYGFFILAIVSIDKCYFFIIEKAPSVIQSLKQK